MPRIVRGGLIQATVTHEGTAPMDTIKPAMIEKHLKLIEEAAHKGCQVVCLQELFYGPYFCAEQKTQWYALTEPVPGGPTISTLWPPAAATSSARLACAWPFTSARSG